MVLALTGCPSTQPKFDLNEGLSSKNLSCYVEENSIWMFYRVLLTCSENSGPDFSFYCLNNSTNCYSNVGKFFKRNNQGSRHSRDPLFELEDELTSMYFYSN